MRKLDEVQLTWKEAAVRVFIGVILGAFVAYFLVESIFFLGSRL